MESLRSCESDLEKIKELDIDSEDDNVNENNDILKRRISNHPLYNLLVESHIDCLQVTLSLSLSLSLDLSLYMKMP